MKDTFENFCWNKECENCSMNVHNKRMIDCREMFESKFELEGEGIYINELILKAQQAIDNDDMEEYERIQELVREEIKKESI
jgi:asparagine synthetase A